MINRHTYSLLLAVLYLFLPLGANSKEHNPEMNKLCKQALSAKFTPLEESLKTPHTDPLFNAIEMGASADTVKKLLNGRKPDDIVIHSMTPLIAAAYTGNWAAAKVLLESGANINFINPPEVTTTPLEASLFKSNFSVACNLVKFGANLPTSKIDQDGLLQQAMVAPRRLQKASAVFVNYLLSNGFDRDDYGNPRETPLMGAVSINNIPVIKVLLKNGARLDIVKQDGRTVWTVAREKNNPQVIKLLKDEQKKESQKNRQPAALVPATV